VVSEDAAAAGPDFDAIRPFQIEGSGLRGRLVRLGPCLDRVLSRHAYPAPVARLLGETVTLAVALAAMLKYQGVFTLQARGDGPVRLVVADVSHSGEGSESAPAPRVVRGYAQFDPERLAALDPAAPAGAALLGRGHLAFTVDQGEHTERYQGIVELSGETLVDSVQHYFRQSEQLDSALCLAVGQGADGAWHGASLIVQRLPENQAQPGSGEEDDWRRAMVLLTSATEAELLDPALPGTSLLWRLFHEDGIRVWPIAPVVAGCRCSEERIRGVIASFPEDERRELARDGVIEVTCEFCSTVYRINADDPAAG